MLSNTSNTLSYIISSTTVIYTIFPTNTYDALSHSTLLIGILRLSALKVLFTKFFPSNTLDTLRHCTLTLLTH